MDSVIGISPELVWGLFPRFVGLIYLFAFGSVLGQVELIASDRGVAPLRPWLAKVRRDFPGARRFFEYPTILWLANSDHVLKALPLIGMTCGACAIYGGVIGWLGLLVGWVIWLSLEPLGLIFPWDTLLQEVGFLVLFLPLVAPLPELTASALPLPSVAFMVRWLVLRLMFGFGKDKFIGVTKKDGLYLRGFFVWMPLPTPLGWYGHHAPAWFLKVSHVFMFFAEIVAPLLGLFSGWPRLVAFSLLNGLMIGIHVTGNWGYFNIGYILLSVCLLDVHASIFDLWREPWSSTWSDPASVAIHCTMGALFFVSLFYLANNTWATRSWVNWPTNYFVWQNQRVRAIWERVHPWLEWLRIISPFRLINGYGVFPPNSHPPMRLVPVFEGSADGQTWKQYGYKHQTSFADSRPPVIAPAHARLDQAVYYYAIQAASLTGSSTPTSTAHVPHARASIFDLIAQNLIAGDAVQLSGLGHNPFPDAPPKLVRVGLLALTPRRIGEQRATGEWWHVRRIGTLIRATGAETWPAKLALSEPEAFHPDLVELKRRSHPLRTLRRAYDSGMPLDQAIIHGSDLTAAEVDTFWDELVPSIARERGDWSSLDARAEQLLARFGVEGLYRMERLLERYAWVLRERVLEHPVAAAEEHALNISNFRLHTIFQEVVLDGRAALEAMLQDPTTFIARAKRTTDATQMWAFGLLRYDQLMIHIGTFRYTDLGRYSHELQLPGIWEYYPLLVRHVPPGETFRPHPTKLDDGEFTIDEFYPPPPLQA
jgi:hypothetical protein